MTCNLQQYTPDWLDGSMEAKDGGEWCRWDEADAEINRLREGLEIIAGLRSCADNLASNPDIALHYLKGNRS